MIFSGLPIEYYDSNVLIFISNVIGRTLKVDNNTLFRNEASVCDCVWKLIIKRDTYYVQVKYRVHTVEYKGLHLLCLDCGKFGHYMESCGEKVTQVAKEGYCL